MSDDSPPAAGIKPPITPPIKPATSYAWRLLMLIPAIALLAYGYWRRVDVPPGGTVTSIRVTSKSNISGQVRDAYAGVSPTTADFYLVLATQDGGTTKLAPFKDTPLGNGLTWMLDTPMQSGDLARVEVWDDNALLSDKQLDRVELSADAWDVDGQTFHIRLNGSRLEPPLWATPLMAVGGVLGAVVILRFVWDQAL